MSNPCVPGTKVKLCDSYADYELITREGVIEEVLDMDYQDELVHYEVKFGSTYLDLSENDFIEIKEK